MIKRMKDSDICSFIAIHEKINEMIVVMNKQSMRINNAILAIENRKYEIHEMKKGMKK